MAVMRKDEASGLVGTGGIGERSALFTQSWAQGSSVGALLEARKGVGPGFDFLRLFLALSIVAWHCFALSYGDKWLDEEITPSARIVAMLWIVPAFFALSGFLVAGSMVRLNKLTVFLTFRALRIFPALTFITLVCALLLGPLATSSPLSSYFADPMFFRFLWNAVGHTQYFLPGVFAENPFPGVINGSLWTVPVELYCYIALAALMLIGIASKRGVMLGIFLVVSFALAMRGTFGFATYTSMAATSKAMLVMCFLCGAVMFLWKDRIFLDNRLCLLAGAAYIAVIHFAPGWSFSIGALCITYVVVFLGMTRIPRIPILMSGDYSYGIYVGAFPIQQALVWAMPGPHNPFLVFLLAAPLSLLLAMFSWHMIEKPALRLRHRLAPASARDTRARRSI